MIQHWFSPDTCDCQFEINANGTFKEEYQKCRFHIALSGQSLFSAVLAHNRSFNESGKSSLQIEIDRDLERKRIKELGPPIVLKTRPSVRVFPQSLSMEKEITKKSTFLQRLKWLFKG